MAVYSGRTKFLQRKQQLSKIPVPHLHPPWHDFIKIQLSKLLT
jgi:hypothetical protein